LHFLPSRGNLSTSSTSNAATSLRLGLPKLNCSNVVSRTYRFFSIGRALMFARTRIGQKTCRQEMARIDAVSFDLRDTEN
jgi:hypothetical protein